MTRSLGRVTPGTVFVRATANLSDPPNGYPCHSVLFQQIPGNIGKVYVAQKEDADRTQVSADNGILAVLAIPTKNLLPSATFTIIGIPGGIAANEFWVATEEPGEGVQVSVMKW